MPAITQAGEEREGAAVCELTNLDLTAWPQGTRAICRREWPHPGAQLTFTDHQGFRFQVFITDQDDADLAQLEARHRGHARVEDRIRCGKDTGLRCFPSASSPPTRSGWNSCSPPRTCSPSSSASVWTARRGAGSPRRSAIAPGGSGGRARPAGELDHRVDQLGAVQQGADVVIGALDDHYPGPPPRRRSDRPVLAGRHDPVPRAVHDGDRRPDPRDESATG